MTIDFMDYPDCDWCGADLRGRCVEWRDLGQTRLCLRCAMACDAHDARDDGRDAQ